MLLLSTSLWSVDTTDLPSNQDFGGIELVRHRKSCLLVPDDWCTLVENAWRNNAFEARRMHNTNSVGSSCLKALIVNWKASTNWDEVERLNIYQICAEKSSPISFKNRCTPNTLEEGKWSTPGARQNAIFMTFERANLPQLYSSSTTYHTNHRGSTQGSKGTPMLHVCSTHPPTHHTFYNNLRVSDEEEEVGEIKKEEDEENED